MWGKRGIELNMRIHESAYRETMATEMHGFLIKAVFQTKTVIGVLLLPLSYINPITTLILGIIGSLAFKIALIPLYAIGLLMLGWLWGTSWLWLNFSILRPLLFLPGVATSSLCQTYIGWLPFYGHLDLRLASINACSSWPLTVAVWRRTVPRE